MVRCRWRGTSPSPASGFQGGAIAPLIDGCRESEVSLLVAQAAKRFWLDDGFDTQRPATGRGDATGARSGSPCQDALYYNAHLAFVAKLEIRAKLKT